MTEKQSKLHEMHCPVLRTSSDYLAQVRADLLGKFRDSHGYVCGTIDGLPHADGEATLYTAIAAIAIAKGASHPDDWEAQNANAVLKDLLSVLLEKSWSTFPGNGAISCPIRHPDLFDYTSEGEKIRQSPLTKDGFSASIHAAASAYRSGDTEVRELAYRLIQKWVEFLVLKQWRTHADYIAGEFEADGKYYKNIYSAPFPGSTPEQRRVTFKGVESFILFPNETWGLQSAASSVGILVETGIWSPFIPQGTLIALKQSVVDIAAPYIGPLIGQFFRGILNKLDISVPYSVQIGPDSWKYNKISGSIDIAMPNSLKDSIQSTVSKLFAEFIEEGVRLDTLWNEQTVDVIDLLINRTLDQFPDVLRPDEWRSILTSAINEVLPWLTGSAWIEATTFVGILGWLKLNPDPSNISYTVWSYANELENRPDIMTVVDPFLKLFFQEIDSQNNPNGFWAWISSSQGEVHRQLAFFEAKSPSYWSNFAYLSKKFNDWAAGGGDPADTEAFPRIDYLALSGLDEVGAPKGLSLDGSAWWAKFRDLLVRNAKALGDAILDEFKRTGKYVRTFIDAAGQEIHEIWNDLGEFSREVYKFGTLIGKNTFNSTIVFFLNQNQSS